MITRSAIEVWNHVQDILKTEGVSEREKLRLCLNAADVHCAMTGDDSLIPPQIREARANTVDGIDVILKRANADRHNAEIGQTIFL